MTEKKKRVIVQPHTYKKKENGKNATGRPSDYRPEYCQSIVEFMSIETHEVYVDTTYYKPSSGDDPKWPLKSETNKMIANRFPTFQRRCHNIWVTMETMKGRTLEYPEFLSAYTKAKAIQESILVENGIQWAYNPWFAMFIAKNNFGYVDKVSTEVTGKDWGAIEIANINELSPKQLDELRQKLMQ